MGAQRVYGITFPEPALMNEYRHRVEEAKKRDHRLLGTQQELFFFDRMSPGSCFFMPAGARVYNALQDVWRRPLLLPCFFADTSCCVHMRLPEKGIRLQLGA